MCGTYFPNSCVNCLHVLKRSSLRLLGNRVPICRFTSHTETAQSMFRLLAFFHICIYVFLLGTIRNRISLGNLCWHLSRLRISPQCVGVMKASAVGVGGQLWMLFQEMQWHTRSPQVASPRHSVLTHFLSQILAVFMEVLKVCLHVNQGWQSRNQSPIHSVYIFKASYYLLAKTIVFFQSLLSQLGVLSDLFHFCFCFSITNVHLLALLRVGAKNPLLLGCSWKENFLPYFFIFKFKIN